MQNSGIVKHAYLVLDSEGEEKLLEYEVVNVSLNGMKAWIKKPGDFRYNIEEDLALNIRIIFNNDRILNLSAKIVWYKDNPDQFEFGLHLSGSIW